MSSLPFFVSIPHSGEKIPPQTPWLVGLPEPILMCDVDRYVDRLYEKTLLQTETPFVKTEWHRYAADLNRLPTDVDAGTLTGSPNAVGSFARGFHWAHTTLKQTLMSGPLSQKVHRELVDLVFTPFHEQVKGQYAEFKKTFKEVYHLDAHSMPSKGTSEHRDPGELRADIVISDSHGKSCSTVYKDIVVAAYANAGFKIAYNWPYYGGRLTEEYGKPEAGQHCIQVELNRGLYMNEQSKHWIPEKAEVVQRQIAAAIAEVRVQVDKIKQRS